MAFEAGAAARRSGPTVGRRGVVAPVRPPAPRDAGIGKILAEGERGGQVLIDICEIATGLSRQLRGLTIASERPRYRMME